MVIYMSLKPPVEEMQHSCGLVLVTQKNSAHLSQQLPTAIFTDCTAIVAVLVLGSGCCSVETVHGVGICFCVVDGGEGWGPLAWVISRLQKGKKVNLSKPRPWLFCTLICPG